MSAFIVSEDCMTRCVLATAKNLAVAQTQEGYSKLGRELYAMNAQAVSQRYEEPPDLELAQSYEFGDRWTGARAIAPGLPPCCPLIEQYKALCCLLYQCSEGDVPQTELYKALVEQRRDLAEDIVNALSAWDQAPWG